MAISEGLRTSLNAIRETSIENGTLYAKQIDEILPTTDISALSTQLFDNENLMNEFLNVLVKRVIYTQVVNFKLFNNPLAFLEGEQMPLGAIGQELFINPAEGREFNVNDFAGLLAKYESDVKVQYMHLNSDKQYPVTITRAKLKDAFTSWSNLESFVDAITQSLYNGAYIDRYNMTKGLVTQAYNNNSVVIEQITNPTTEQQAKTFLTKARTLYLNMQEPSADFNAWRKVGGYGRDVLTWTDREDIVFLIRNDLASYLDVNVLASAFNIDKASLLGRIKYVKDFNVRNTKGDIVLNGDNILGIMADKKWFRIKNQEITMDEFYNANNRTWQMYLNDVNMYQYSLFCNAVVFATAQPQVAITGLTVSNSNVTLGELEETTVTVSTTPAQANTPEITVSSSKDTIAKANIVGRTITIVGASEGTARITVTAGNVSTEINVTVTDRVQEGIQSGSSGDLTPPG